jgi:hypothetical protein
MKTYWGMEVYLQAFLVSVLDGEECSASLPDRFTPEVRVPISHWIGGRVGPTAGLDAVAKRENPIIAPAGNWTPVVQPVA